MKHKIRLIIGREGHNYINYLIESTLSSEELCQAYKLGFEKIGFDLVRKVATRYGEATMKIDDYLMLEAAGYIDEDPAWTAKRIEEGKENGMMWVEPDFYLSLYFFIVKLGDSSFEYQFVKDEFDNLEIGGYGMLS